MRKTLLAIAAATAVFATGAMISAPAHAITISTPAGVAAAIDDTNLAENVAYVCRRVRVCGYYGCTWRRRCYNTRPYYRPYYQPRYYGHRHRHGYRHRYYRRY